MKHTLIAAAVLAAAASAQAQVTVVNQAITQPEVLAAQQAWCTRVQQFGPPELSLIPFESTT